MDNCTLDSVAIFYFITNLTYRFDGSFDAILAGDQISNCGGERCTGHMLSADAIGLRL